MESYLSRVGVTQPCPMLFQSWCHSTMPNDFLVFCGTMKVDINIHNLTSIISIRHIDTVSTYEVWISKIYSLKVAWCYRLRYYTDPAGDIMQFKI